MKRLAILLLLTSCMTTTIIGEPYEVADTTMVRKPHKDFAPKDTTQVDTTRIPIEFQPIVEDWEETEIDY